MYMSFTSQKGNQGSEILECFSKTVVFSGRECRFEVRELRANAEPVDSNSIWLDPKTF